MSLQHNAIELLDYTANTLNGLAEDSSQPANCRYAAARLGEAATRLRVEPCRPEDIRASFDIMVQAKSSLCLLKQGEHPTVVRGWVDSACYTYNAIIDLMEALEAFHKHITLDQAASTRPMSSRLMGLLPAGWGGDRHD
jgi:hypothetical protein